MYSGTRATTQMSNHGSLAYNHKRVHVPERPPTPKPETKRPKTICARARFVAVWMTVPAVKIADHMMMDNRLPNRSAVNACVIAPTIVLRKRCGCP